MPLRRNKAGENAPDTMTIEELRRNTLNDYPGICDLDLIIALALGRPREWVLAHPEYALKQPQARKTGALLRRRMSGEPFAYLAGKKEFLGLEFIVDKNVLIPRPETEMLAEKAYELATSRASIGKTVLIDIGTGSGAIAISAAVRILENPEKEILKGPLLICASDASKTALRIARRNAVKHSADGIIRFFEGDLLLPHFETLKFFAPDALIIAANLPYLTLEEIASEPSIACEPRLALNGGRDGLDLYRRLFDQVSSFTSSQTIAKIDILCEIDPSQHFALSEISKRRFKKAGIAVYKDLTGNNRVLHIKIKGGS